MANQSVKAKPTWIKIGNMTIRRRSFVGWIERESDIRILMEIGDCSWTEDLPKEKALEDIKRLQTQNHL
jgi:hypothetical protein